MLLALFMVFVFVLTAIVIMSNDDSPDIPEEIKDPLLDEYIRFKNLCYEAPLFSDREHYRSRAVEVWNEIAEEEEMFGMKIGLVEEYATLTTLNLNSCSDEESDFYCDKMDDIWRKMSAEERELVRN